MTELGGALLAYAARAEAEGEGEALVMPTVRQVVRTELNLFLERLLDFQVRTYMEAGTARRMVQVAMEKGGQPLAREEVKRQGDIQWRAAWQATRTHFEGLLELKRLMGYSATLPEIAETEGDSGAASS